MQVAQANEIKVFEARARLAKTQERAAARIDQDTRLAVDSDEVARR